MEFGALLGGMGGGGGMGGSGVGAGGAGAESGGLSRASSTSSIYAPNTQNASTLNPWLIGGVATVVAAVIVLMVWLLKR